MRMSRSICQSGNTPMADSSRAEPGPPPDNLSAAGPTAIVHRAAIPTPARGPPPAGLVAPAARPAAAAVVTFLEGPAVDAAGNVYFSDIAGNRILRMDAAGKVSVFRADSGRTNGNTFDAGGRLISCEGAENGP